MKILNIGTMDSCNLYVFELKVLLNEPHLNIHHKTLDKSEYLVVFGLCHFKRDCLETAYFEPLHVFITYLTLVF